MMKDTKELWQKQFQEHYEAAIDDGLTEGDAAVFAASNANEDVQEYVDGYGDMKYQEMRDREMEED